MKKSIILGIIISLFSAYSFTSESEIPLDIQEYIDSIETCQHFSNEWDNSLPEDRKKEIEEGSAEYCKKAKILHNKLKNKYKDDIHKIKILDEYDMSIQIDL
ncbi:hypothetical protein J8V57_09125 [Xenorhabdus sp. PB61.4]|uniref:hypothetical protein n=1 Tax=Xenorhabdus sp. PB61.4 TaxID=2788940 RepID=UPI001E60C728|nr:hypothetical protein [Xenorhabdus sp. PB61.4]MCC8366442.1 hypothetical protein [Xenorhabdus sp. PB61.4]